MTEERQRHIQELKDMKSNYVGFNKSDMASMTALIAAIAALEREGQMEARLRWTMEFLRSDLEADNIIVTGDLDAYCAWIDKEIAKEASDG